MNTRPPAVAGTFYPAGEATLRGMVSGFLDEAAGRDLSPKAIVVPHAGYIYSGPIAASAYALLAPVADQIKRVVLLGPTHHIPFEGLALPESQIFMTPLGPVNLDTEIMSELLRFSQVQPLDAAHEHEHSLEVQCPFLQSCLPEFKLIPLVVGSAPPLAVAEVLDFLWGNDETLIVISTDLSHYHNYEEACSRDNVTRRAIEQLHTNLTGGQACGAYPLNGLLSVAQRRGMEVITLDIRNSGDTAGDKQRVVGYGAFAVQ
ncbi:AmmeMemoRadiSam system protein B [Endozoicomonadaceae bacterium StTr2]